MPAVAFDDLLDEQLAAGQPPPASHVRNPGPTGVGAAYGFFFATSPDRTGLPAMTSHAIASDVGARLFASIDAVVMNSDSHHGSRTHTAVVSQMAPTRHSRLLSAHEREAVAVMETLGASLPEGFSIDELRSAFRSLALAYHPDRHAARGAQEQARLGALFTQARDAYELLSGMFVRVH